MSQPLKLSIYLLGFIVFTNLLLMALWFNSVVLMFAIAVVLLLCSKFYAKSRAKNVDVTTEGFVIGSGIDITNPDLPIKAERIVIHDSILNLGRLGIGGPDSGKSSLEVYTLHYFTSASLGWAYLDGKGAKDIYQKAVSIGAVPDFFFSSELPGSHTMNILGGDAFDVIERATRMWVSDSTSTSFYSDEQREALQIFIPMLCGLSVPANTRDLFIALTDDRAAKSLISLAKRDGIDPTTRRLYETYLERNDRATRLKNLKGMINRMSTFANSALADRLNDYDPDIVISDIVHNKKRVYFHLPYTTFSRDVAIAVTELFGVEARRRQQQGTTNVDMFPLSFDDWGDFFYDNFSSISARCRSAKIPLNFSFQSLAQLQQVTQQFADILDDTLATKLLFRVNGISTSQYASRTLGTYEKSLSSLSFGDHRSGLNVNLLDHFRINSNQLMSSAPGEVYISTLSPVRHDRKLFRARIPYLSSDNWKCINWPTIERKPQSKIGLNFWHRYMGQEIVQRLNEAQDTKYDDVLTDY